MTNTLLSVSALVIMNGVQQLLIYPSLTKQMGTDAFGNVLVILGIIAIVAPATGQSVNNMRIVVQNRYECKNGDANITIAMLYLPGAMCCVFFLREYFNDILTTVLLLLLIFFTALKNYSDVEYRLNLNYKRYFCYYCAISLGYVMGLGVYVLSHSWLLTMLIGEVSGFAYVFVTGTIYREPFERSQNFKRFFRDSLLLYTSYLLYNGVLNLDRVLLKYMLDSETVTIYYVASLMGKTIALLVGPLNSIAISYLCKRKSGIDLKLFALLVTGTIVVSSGFYVASCIITPIFADIAYHEIYSTVVQHATIANLSQVICFTASFLLTIVLTVASNRWQMVIQSVYAISFLLLTMTMCAIDGFNGFLWGLVLANCIRLIFTILVGFISILKAKRG